MRDGIREVRAEPRYPARRTATYGSMRPRRIAYRTSSTRSRMPSLRIAFERWFSTVFSERWRIAAISLLVWASATSFTTSCSRGVRSSSRLDRTHGLEQIGVRLSLQHVARRPRLQGLEQVALVVVHREDQHRHVGRLLA